MSKPRPCVECGLPYDKKAGRKNPYWCPKCDEERIARVGKQLEAIAERMGIKP